MSKSKNRRPQRPKERNFFARAVRDPNSPFRPKTIPDKRTRQEQRRRKHKGRLDDEE